jgi:hypothetical protein
LPWAHIFYCPGTERYWVIYSEVVDGMHATWV